MDKCETQASLQSENKYKPKYMYSNAKKVKTRKQTKYL